MKLSVVRANHPRVKWSSRTLKQVLYDYNNWRRLEMYKSVRTMLKAGILQHIEANFKFKHNKKKGAGSFTISRGKFKKSYEFKTRQTAEARKQTAKTGAKVRKFKKTHGIKKAVFKAWRKESAGSSVAQANARIEGLTEQINSKVKRKGKMVYRYKVGSTRREKMLRDRRKWRKKVKELGTII